MSTKCFVQSAFHVIKGAACIALSIPTGRTTKCIRFKGDYKGEITLGKVPTRPSDSQFDLIKLLIEQKITEDARFKSILVDRSIAEDIYGDVIYDENVLSDSITRLRLVMLEEHSINAHLNPVVKSTGLLKSIQINKFKFDENNGSLNISFSVEPNLQSPEETVELCEDEEISNAADCPKLAFVLPPGEASYGGDVFAKYFNLEKTVTSKGEAGKVDYDKLIVEFGCSKITKEQLERIERLTGAPVHPFLRRGLFFSHRGLDPLLDYYEKHGTFFIYTGRGPSTDTLHLGHLIPFMFTCYLQKAFKVPVFIMLSDDEKYVFREELEFNQVRQMALENAKDIIACGFDPNLTFIYRNTDYIGNLYPIALQLMKRTSFNQLRGIFGLSQSANAGKICYPAIQCAAAFSQTYPQIYGNRSVMSLVPQGIDQDPFFRMTRDLAPRVGLLKPSVIHSKFIPSLLGVGSKMSASCESSAIFVNDDPDTIRKKILKYAYSGGGDTASEQREKGANLEIDVAYQYLRYFLHDDQQLQEIETAYSNGTMLSGEVKNKLADLIIPQILEYQARRQAVTDETVRLFMDPTRSMKI
ncbi:bifunctional Rossmann-like alpha-beta-alpha sandwich fold/Tryptophan-tRNA ligase/Aminoacyl-tRNA synthetase [Babesia duncani]|uniref:tryptophan--tRNA ligase n=1 Tax=Babesia duncani TaxID=323732 RepID=A0AAD9PLE2_9APIC|nr:bifunctional Rossmann-like alpha-beta-alpha sandwich fold/Tryptophan-tRNA ligase/Aminoacyl-tRNA synthetase [Babesia duncani]